MSILSPYSPDEGVPPVVVLKPGDPEVAAAIHRVWLASYQVEAELIGVADFPPLARTEHQIAASENLFLGIRATGELAAAAEVELPSPDTAMISALVVHPDHFRRGLGRALVRHVLERFPDRTIEVSTAVANEPALALYRGLGFSENRRWTHRHRIAMVALVHDPSL